MATQLSVIKAFMASLDKNASNATAAVNNAIANCSSFGNKQTVVNKLIDDCKSYVAADSKNGWKKFLLEKCGINLDNKDTGAITGKDAGGSNVKTAESIVPESGSLDTKFEANSFKQNGLTFKLEKNFKKLSTKEKFIWRALKTWWAKSALDLIKTSYGYSFTDSDVNFKTITVCFKEDNSTTNRAWNAWHDRDSKGKDDGKVDSVELVINMRYYKDISTTNSNGYSSKAGFYLDKTLAHELTHTIMHAKVFNSYELPEFITEGLAELTIGIDEERASDITYLAKNPSTLLKNLNGSSTAYSYEAGYIFFRYLAKQASTTNKSLLGTANDDSFNNSVSGATIQTYGGKDRVYNTGTKAKIYTGAGVDSIFNHAATVTIDGGNDADYISNQGNKVTIRGGAGKDTIKNWAASVTIDGGNNDDRLYNYASKTVTMIGGDGADYIDNSGAAASMVGGNGNDTLTGYSGADTLSGGVGNDKLYGNNGNDIIYGSNGNDSLWGGKGNDTLYGDADKDTFYYSNGDGKDVIYKFANDDMLKITGSFTTSLNNSKKEIYFKVGSTANAITLKNYSATTFNINGTNYKVGSSSLIKK